MPTARGNGMKTKHRGHDQESWTCAKKVCRLNVRQLEMALACRHESEEAPRPAPEQAAALKNSGGRVDRGALLEALRWQFTRSTTACRCELRASLPPRRATRHSPNRVQATGWQLSNLICYLTNLGRRCPEVGRARQIDRELLPQVAQELREIAAALETGAWIDPIPRIPLPPGRTSSWRDDEEPPFDDDIPF